MRKFQALALAKYSDAGSVAGILGHDSRDRIPENADPKRTGQNIVLAGGSSMAQDMAKWRSLLPRDEKGKRIGRHDAVTLTEIVIQASPEKTAEMVKKGTLEKYFREVHENLVKKFCQHGNLIRSDIHMDELTPHMHFSFVPLTLDQKTGKVKLCHKDVLGHPKQLTALHTDLHREVGKKYGLDRAIEGSRANHQTIKAFMNGIENRYMDLMKDITVDRRVREMVQDMKERLEAYHNAKEDRYEAKDLETEKTVSKALLERDRAISEVRELKLSRPREVAEALKPVREELTWLQEVVMKGTLEDVEAARKWLLERQARDLKNQRSSGLDYS